MLLTPNYSSIYRCAVQPELRKIAFGLDDTSTEGRLSVRSSLPDLAEKL